MIERNEQNLIKQIAIITLPIVVSTVDEKNTACDTLHFLNMAGKLSATDSLKPPSTARCATYL